MTTQSGFYRSIIATKPLLDWIWKTNHCNRCKSLVSAVQVCKELKYLSLLEAKLKALVTFLVFFLETGGKTDFILVSSMFFHWSFIPPLEICFPLIVRRHVVDLNLSNVKKWEKNNLSGQCNLDHFNILQPLK